MSDRSEEIDAASKGLRRLSSPNTFAAVVALIAIGGYLFKDYTAAKSQQEERAAFVAALDRNTAAIQKFTETMSVHEREASIRWSERNAERNSSKASP